MAKREMTLKLNRLSREVQETQRVSTSEAWRSTSTLGVLLSYYNLQNPMRS